MRQRLLTKSQCLTNSASTLPGSHRQRNIPPKKTAPDWPEPESCFPFGRDTLAVPHSEREDPRSEPEGRQHIRRSGRQLSDIPAKENGFSLVSRSHPRAGGGRHRGRAVATGARAQPPGVGDGCLGPSRYTHAVDLVPRLVPVSGPDPAGRPSPRRSLRTRSEGVLAGGWHDQWHGTAPVSLAREPFKHYPTHSITCRYGAETGSRSSPSWPGRFRPISRA